jgi:branched-chain amino acid transport system permease protein
VRFWADGGFAVTLTPMQMLNTAAFCVLILAGSFYLGRSAFGRRWKAVSDDAFAAALCGVNAGRIFLVSYCAAGLIAAIAGVLATFYYGTMDFGAGLVFGLKVVLISAAGGYASPLICGLGAAAVGFAETFWVGYGSAAWRDAVVLAMLVGWLIVMRSRVEAP